MLPNLLDPRPYFADRPDPRRETQNKLHQLHDLLMIVLCAVLNGVEDWGGMADFAEEKEAWLRGFLELPNGIPAHAPLSDVMGRIDPVAFRTAFPAWATAALPALVDEPVCGEGQAGRGRRDGATGAIQWVSALAGRARWGLAPQAVAEKSTAIPAIPALRALLDLQGAVVSTDALGCQQAIAPQLVAAGADSVLARKDHHPPWCDDVQVWLDPEIAGGRRPVQEPVEKDHGRSESRRSALRDQIDWVEANPDWTGLQAVGRVESIRSLGDQTSTEYRYFLCSFPQRDQVAATVRGHWGIENQQHWVLEVQFGEEACRTRKTHSADNLALVRRRALNLLSRNGLPRDSIRRRKRRAGLNDESRVRLLFGNPTPVTI
jgi:predicted transposase YbfD/YdcC